jgi:hypothetical protein
MHGTKAALRPALQSFASHASLRLPVHCPRHEHTGQTSPSSTHWCAQEHTCKNSVAGSCELPAADIVAGKD